MNIKPPDLIKGLAKLGIDWTLLGIKIGWDVQVTGDWDDLNTAYPAASHTGEIALITDNKTVLGLITKHNGLYISNGVAWIKTNLKVQFTDDSLEFKDDVDTTKELNFQLSNISTVTTRIATWPDKDITVAGIDDLTADNINIDATGETVQDHIDNINNPHEVTKTQVGLSNVPNLDTTTAVSQTHVRSHSILSTSDHSDVNDIIDIPGSPMILTGGVLSEGTNVGTLKVSASTALLRTTDSTTGNLIKVTLAEQDNQIIPLTDTIYKVVLDYFVGAPQILIQVAGADHKREINIGTCIKDTSNTVHYTNGGFRLAESAKKLHRRAGRLRKWEMSRTITMTDEENKQFSISSGHFYKGINEFTFTGFDSSTTGEEFTYVYYDGDLNAGEWVYVENQTDIDVNNYNDVATGLSALSKFKCDWVFVHPDDGHVYVVYGQDDDKEGIISDSTVPILPDIIDTFGMLIGRIIIESGTATFHKIEMISTTTFNPQVVIDHNDNSNIQGGTTDEYYHLTAAQHTETIGFFAATDISGAEAETLTDGSNADTLHYHDASNIITDETGTSVQDSLDTLAAAGGGGGFGSEIIISASAFILTETNIPEFVEDSGTNGKIDTLSFNDSTEEFANLYIKLSNDLDTSGTVTFRIDGYAATATADKFVEFRLSHSAKTAGEDWDAAFSTLDSGDLACDADQDELDHFIWTETIANLGWAKNDTVRLKLSRIAPAGANLSGDYRLILFKIDIPRA